MHRGAGEVLLAEVEEEGDEVERVPYANISSFFDLKVIVCQQRSATFPTVEL